jgi:hypothetical protein
MRCCAPACPVSIPDAVYTEATRAPGADRIVAWINDHLDMGRIVPTDIGIDQQRRLDEGRPARGLGEQAAIARLVAARLWPKSRRASAKAGISSSP